jgi:hypothetical protein
VPDQEQDEDPTPPAGKAPAGRKPTKPTRPRRAKSGTLREAGAKASAGPETASTEPAMQDPSARAAQKRRVRAEREQRQRRGGAKARDADPSVTSRLRRIEETLYRQSELTEELLRKIELLVGPSRRAESRKTD